VTSQVRLELGQGREQKPFAEIGGYRANELVLSVKDPAAAAAAQRMEQQLASETPAPQQTAPTTAPASEPAIGRSEVLPSEGGLAGTSWTGTSAELLDGEYTVEFLKDGQLNYVFNRIVNGKRERTTVKGKWRQVESFVHITILTRAGNSYSVWQGRLEGGLIKGTTSNAEGNKGDFVLFKNSP
jgi:hypothetical protein